MKNINEVLSEIKKAGLYEAAEKVLCAISEDKEVIEVGTTVRLKSNKLKKYQTTGLYLINNDLIVTQLLGGDCMVKKNKTGEHAFRVAIDDLKVIKEASDKQKEINKSKEIDSVEAADSDVALVFDNDSIEKVEKGVKASYVKSGRPPLDDGTSIYVDVALDKKENWPYKIFMNSRYSTFFIYNNGVIEQIHKSYIIKDKFRKSKAKSLDDAIGKINKYVELISKENSDNVE